METATATPDADAAFDAIRESMTLAEIVHKVNCHDDLLAACKARVAEWHANPRNFERAEPESLKLARAAIRKAAPPA